MKVTLINTSMRWRRACGLYGVCSSLEQDEVDVHLLAQNKYTSERLLRLLPMMCLAWLKAKTDSIPSGCLYVFPRKDKTYRFAFFNANRERMYRVTT